MTSLVLQWCISIVPWQNTIRGLEIRVLNTGSAWTECTTCLKAIARFVSTCWRTGLSHGTLLSIPVSRLAIPLTTTLWPSVDILELREMWCGTTTVDSSPLQTAITMLVWDPTAPSRVTVEVASGLVNVEMLTSLHHHRISFSSGAIPPLGIVIRWMSLKQGCFVRQKKKRIWKQTWCSSDIYLSHTVSLSHYFIQLFSLLNNHTFQGTFSIPFHNYPRVTGVYVIS